MLTAPQFSPAVLQSVRTRIARAAERAGRDPGSVRLLAVSKQQPAALVGFQIAVKVIRHSVLLVERSQLRAKRGMGHQIGAQRWARASGLAVEAREGRWAATWTQR